GKRSRKSDIEIRIPSMQEASARYTTFFVALCLSALIVSVSKAQDTVKPASGSTSASTDQTKKDQKKADAAKKSLVADKQKSKEPTRSAAPTISTAKQSETNVVPLNAGKGATGGQGTIEVENE